MAYHRIKNKAFLFDGIILLIGCIILFDISESIFHYIIATFAGMGAFYLFFGKIAYVEFNSNSTVVKERFSDPVKFINPEILGLTITESKIYLQTSTANFTIKKNWYNSDDFDRIANELLKISRK